MRPLNALLLDECDADRESLRRMLLRHPAICVGAEFSSPRQVGAGPWDVIFTDSSFREGSLNDVCGGFPSGAQMVIVAADKDFAWQAFELDAVDFLVKPLDAKRLAEAVRRLLRLDWRPASSAGQESLPEVVIIPFERGRRGVALRDICAIQAFGNYSRVLLAGGGRELVLRSLNRWQQALPAGSFLRVHRNAIVNRDRVRGLENDDGDSALLQVEGLTESIVVSRRQAAALKKLLYVKIP